MAVVLWRGFWWLGEGSSVCHRSLILTYESHYVWKFRHLISIFVPTHFRHIVNFALWFMARESHGVKEVRHISCIPCVNSLIEIGSVLLSSWTPLLGMGSVTQYKNLFFTYFHSFGCHFWCHLLDRLPSFSFFFFPFMDILCHSLVYFLYW